MKLTNLRPCDNCGGEISPHFYIVRTSLAFISQKATNQVLGLNQMFGGDALGLAEVMAPDAEAVKIAGDEDSKLMNEIFLCQICYMDDVNLALLVEKIVK